PQSGVPTRSRSRHTQVPVPGTGTRAHLAPRHVRLGHQVGTLPPQPALLHGAPRVFRHGVGTITFGAWHRLFVPHMSDAGLDGGLMNVLREAPQDGRVCFWWHSVPKVEYMTRPPRSTLEDIPRRRLHPLPRPEQNRGIEVPLHAAIVANLAPPAVES